MKHLQKFENYSKDDVKRVLTDAVEKGDVNVDDILRKLDSNTEPDWRTDPFGYMVYTNAKFISESNKKNMPEYVEKLKGMNVDTTKLEELLPKYMKYRQYYLFDEDKIRMSGDSDKKKDQAYNELYTKMDRLEPFVKEFEEELRKILKSLK